MGRASKGRVADWFVGGLAQVLVVLGLGAACSVGSGCVGGALLVTFVAWIGCMARVGYTVHVHGVLDALSLFGFSWGFPLVWAAVGFFLGGAEGGMCC